MSKNTNPTHVITGKCRASYVHVDKPVAIQEGSPEKYSVCIVIPKSDTVTLDKIQKAIDQAIEDGIRSKWKGKKPAKLKLPLRDGDDERPEDPTFANACFINANSSRKPGLVDRDRNEILDDEEIYSGCYCRFSIDLYPYAASGSNGVGVGLNHVQKLADGPRLGNRTRAEDDFNDDYEDDEEYDDL